MARPTFEEAERRRAAFAEALYQDKRRGGMAAVERNVARHAKDAGLDPWRALKLSWDESFIAEVHRFRSS